MSERESNGWIGKKRFVSFFYKKNTIKKIKKKKIEYREGGNTAIR